MLRSVIVCNASWLNRGELLILTLIRKVADDGCQHEDLIYCWLNA